MSAAVARARRTVAPPTSDARLVTAFAESGDAEAFAELVRRHGPMVLGVCRKVTRHAQDAEDAAQAAFLVLARRAGSIRPAGVASWLFGVAVNTARVVRRGAGRRARREVLAVAVPEVGRADPDPDFDTRAAVAEEVARLPDRLRELVVRCDLEGGSQVAVARALGLPVGTVHSRLAAARATLAGRLARRGVAASAAVLAAPAAGAAFVASDCPSARVTELTEAVMRTGFAVRWGWVAAVALAAGVAAGGVETPRPRPAAGRPGGDGSRIALGLAGHVRFVAPDGKELARVSGADAKKAGADIPTRSLSVGLSSEAGLVGSISEIFAPCGRLTPDGRLPLATRKGLYLFAPGGTADPVQAAGGRAVFPDGKAPEVVAWSPDGKKAVGRWPGSGGYFSRTTFAHTLVDAAAGTTTPVRLPAGHAAVDWSADGNWFLTIRNDEEWSPLNGWTSRDRVLCRVSADGRTATDLTPPAETVLVAALSPDGTRAAFITSVNTTVGDWRVKTMYFGFDLVVLDVATGVRRVLASERGGPRADGTTHHHSPGAVRWSPDGTRVAFAHDHVELGEAVRSGWRVRTAAADGSAATTVFTIDRRAAPDHGFAPTLIDWR